MTSEPTRPSASDNGALPDATVSTSAPPAEPDATVSTSELPGGGALAPTPPHTGKDPAVTVRGLRVSFPALDHPAVDGIDFDVYPGQCVALVGESGSGKSVTARSLLGLSGGQVQAQTLRVLGHDCISRGRVARSEKQWLAVRRSGVAMITQDALAGLDPLRKVGAELEDAAASARRAGRAQPGSVAEVLAQVGLAEGERVVAQRPHELSGGMRQRALVAAALLADPLLLIADEATTALDVRLTNLVLDQLAAAKARSVAVLLISHDLAQVAKVADHILVMRGGKVVESGPTAEVLGHPQSEYTRMLLASIPDRVPRGQALLGGSGEIDGPGASIAGAMQRPEPLSGTDTTQRPAQPSSAPDLAPAQTPPASSAAPETAPSPALTVPALALRGLVKHYPQVRAVDGVDLQLWPGRTLGLVGESGCGKSTTARLALGLETPDAGEVRLAGERFSPLPFTQARQLRAHLGAIYQNPLASFDPRYQCGQILALAATAGRSKNWQRQSQTILSLLSDVGLDEDVATRLPSELSGGQRQRLAIARALARHPGVLVFDEPVSALDVSIQARVLDLLDEIQARTQAAYLFISHDLAVVEHMSDEVAVMYQGKIVERGDTSSVFGNPQHPYAAELMEQRIHIHH